MHNFARCWETDGAFFLLPRQSKTSKRFQKPYISEDDGDGVMVLGVTLNSALNMVEALRRWFTFHVSIFGLPHQHFPWPSSSATESKCVCWIQSASWAVSATCVDSQISTCFNLSNLCYIQQSLVSKRMLSLSFIPQSPTSGSCGKPVERPPTESSGSWSENRSWQRNEDTKIE